MPLLNAGTIRPLDDLVAKYGQKLTPNQLIKVDGKIMAIAMMVNAQHLMYRKDILEDLGLPLADNLGRGARRRREDQGLPASSHYPLGATFKADWNIGIDFVNLFVGLRRRVRQRRQHARGQHRSRREDARDDEEARPSTWTRST